MTPLSQSLCFNFHNIVTVEVHTDRPEDAAFFSAEYRYHQAKELPTNLPKVVLCFQRIQKLKRLSEKHNFHQHKFIARWGYHIELAPDRIELNVTGNQLAVPMVHHMLLHPSLRYLSSRQGVLLLHAGAVAHQGYSLIFTGRGGTGKTTITSLMLAGGGQAWSPHADDYVFIGPGPTSMAYMTRSHLYRDLLYWVPEIKPRLSRDERLRLQVYGKIRKWSREGITWPVRLPVDRLWPDRQLQFHAIPAAFIILKRSSIVQNPRLRQIPMNETPIDELVEMNFREAIHFITLLKKGNFHRNLDNWLKKWQTTERKLLLKRLEEFPSYTLEFPNQLSHPLNLRSELVEKLAGLTTINNTSKDNVTV